MVLHISYYGTGTARCYKELCGYYVGTHFMIPGSVLLIPEVKTITGGVSDHQVSGVCPLYYGFFCYRIGRKKTMLICVFIQGISGLLTGLVPTNYYGFIILRFITGGSSMGLFMTNFVLGK